MTAKADGSGVDADAVLLARFAEGDQSAARALTDQLLPGAMRQAWRLAPYDGSIRYNLGLTYQAMHMFVEAEERGEKVAE